MNEQEDGAWAEGYVSEKSCVHRQITRAFCSGCLLQEVSKLFLHHYNSLPALSRGNEAQITSTNTYQNQMHPFLPPISLRRHTSSIYVSPTNRLSVFSVGPIRGHVHAAVSSTEVTHYRQNRVWKKHVWAIKTKAIMYIYAPVSVGHVDIADYNSFHAIGNHKGQRRCEREKNHLLAQVVQEKGGYRAVPLYLLDIKAGNSCSCLFGCRYSPGWAQTAAGHTNHESRYSDVLDTSRWLHLPQKPRTLE